jgi:hypothetical protein
MKTRITEKDLLNMVDRLNKLTEHEGQPIVNGTWQVGHYMLGFAYGGVQLQQVATPGGGVRTPLHHGYLTKRALAYKLEDFIDTIACRTHERQFVES